MKKSRRSDSYGVERKRRIDQLCDQIESQWRQGQCPNLRGLSEPLDDLVPGFLAEIIRVDMEVNQRSEAELRKRYLDDFPEHAEVVVSILESLFRLRTGELTEITTRDDRAEQHRQDDLIGSRIGDYIIDKKIGGGGFGVVYLASDIYLPRQVVIKIPRLQSGSAGDINLFLNEARNVVLLDHENILRVFHVGVDESLPYIVQEFFEGGDLRNALDKNPFSIDATLRLVEKVARAIGYAHQHHIVHRDLKPANILIKRNGDPVIADFGLALQKRQMPGREGEMAGTIRYMSPEQVRGEAHRLDGRTDIWSIGVILYLMLVGEHPFDGDNIKEIDEAILFGRPCPPRQLNNQISTELDRICLKCLSIRINDRYSNAFDLAEDLSDACLAKSNIQPKPTIADKPADSPIRLPVVPKGLVAFDSSDADFFQQLLPGPFDRNGLPEGIRFWKDRIENTGRSYPVSLIYGPSGCGKSSLVSAGILPALANQILVVQIEATADDTEVRLLKGLRNLIPTLPQQLSLPEMIAEVRDGSLLPQNRRLLIVLDQFEQWLHANRIDEHAQLIQALRHCDGSAVQALILVRDDFWMAISRFFRELEIELVERHNLACVDLFSKRHARDVLIRFGQAYGCLPDNERELSSSQEQFLNQSIDLISEKDSVNCVRLPLFAETFKNKSWEVNTLSRIGNSKNIGIAFLEQVLGSGAGNPKYRFFRKPILAVLESLLPDPGIEIKGNLRSRQDLAQAAKLPHDSSDFDTVLKILDNELRLITPTEPDLGISRDDHRSESYYQLTHDYLVPSLREWMTSIRGRSRRGRARLRLQGLANAWQSGGDRRFLPGFFEYCSIVWHVRRHQLNSVEKRFMGEANRYFGRRAAALAVVVGMMIFLGWQFAANRRFEQTRTRVSQFMTCEPDQVPLVLEYLQKDVENARSLVKSTLQTTESDQERNRLRIGLAMLGELSDNGIEQLVDHVQQFKSSECENLIAALSQNPSRSIEQISNVLATDQDGARLDDEHWARLQILKMFLRPEKISSDVFEFGPDQTRRTTLIHHFSDWHGDLNQGAKMLTSLLGSESDIQKAATFAGLCVVFGRMDPQAFEEHSRSELVDMFRQLYQANPSAAAHSASRWALEKWGLPWRDSKRKNGREFSSETDKSDREWKVYDQNDENLTMIKINAGAVPNQDRDSKDAERVEHDFFISDCEITIELFQKFVDDKSYLEEKPEEWERDTLRNSRPNCPVNNISREDAVQFCNWLSTINRLQPCYQKKNGEAINRWELIPDTDGFRLPDQLEWELAARGGSITDYYCAHRAPFEVLLEYFWCGLNGQINDQEVVHPVRQKIPNAFGLFDVLGNVQEICWGRPPVPELNAEFDQTYAQGGSYRTEIIYIRFTNRFHPSGKPTQRVPSSGFRVVKTIVE